MGFDRNRALSALQACKGDAARAVEMLLGQRAVQPVKQMSSDQEEIVISTSDYSPSSTISMTLILASLLLGRLTSESPKTFCKHQLLDDMLLEEIQLSSEKHASIQLMNVVDFLVDCSELHLVGDPFQGLLTDRTSFHVCFERARATANAGGCEKSYVGVVITKSPETVCVFLPPIGSNESFYLFDSHSRPHLNINGSYLVQTYNINVIFNRLGSVFPVVAADDNHHHPNPRENIFEAFTIIKPRKVEAEALPVASTSGAAAAASGAGASISLEAPSSAADMDPPHPSVGKDYEGGVALGCTSKEEMEEEDGYLLVPRELS